MLRFVMVGLLLTGVCLSAQEPKAEDLAKKPPYERLLKGDDAKKAERLEQRAEESQAADDYAGAIKLAEQLLQLRKRLQGTDHHQVKTAEQEVVALKKVAALDAKERGTWRQVSSRLREAEQLENSAQYATALTIRKEILDTLHKVLGEDHPDTAASYNGVAVNLQAQGKAAEAGPLYKKAMDICRKVLGEDHPHTATSYNNLALNLQAQGRTAEAGPMLQKALGICRKVLGEDHPHTATSYSGVAFNLQAQGKAAEAGPMLQKALDIRRKVLSEDHPHTATSYNGVADNLQAQGKAAEAGPLYHKALDIHRKVLSEDHPDTAFSYNGVAANLQAQGKTAEAGPLYKKALDIRRKVLGEEHPDTATSYNNVAINLDAQGKAAEAGPLLQKALDICRKVLGEDHPQTATSYFNLAFNLQAQGKAAEAGPMLQKALDIRRKVLGEDHPHTATSYNGVAANLQAQGKAAEAGPLFQTALNIRRKVLGEEHPETAQSYNNVAGNLDAQGKAAEAGPLLRKALDINRKVLGEEHPDTTTSYNNVALNFVDLGDIGTAKSTLADGIRAYESSRLVAATGLERGNLTQFNPRLLLASLMAAQEPRAAWRQLELTLARGLFDQQSSATRLTVAEQRTQKEARQRVAALQPRILNLVSNGNRSANENQELQELLNQRRQQEEIVARLAVLESERAVEFGERIQTALPGDAAILYWVDVSGSSGRMEEHWACVVRNAGEPKWVRLPGFGPSKEQAIADIQLTYDLRTELAKSPQDPAKISDLFENVKAQRIAPILKHLEGITTLYVVPVELMAGIPIEPMLPDRTISYVPSGTFLARRGKPSQQPNTLLALGDPVFPKLPELKPSPTVLPPNGLLITQVVPNGSADKANLKAGDVLVSYAGTKLNRVEELGKLVAENAMKKEVTIEFWREADDKVVPRDIAPGRLGVLLDKEPAREAIAAKRKHDVMMATLTRGEEWSELPGTSLEVAELKKLFGDAGNKYLTRSDASEQNLDAMRKKDELKNYKYLHIATHGKTDNFIAFNSKIVLSQDRPKAILAPAGEPLLDNQLLAREVLDHWKLNAEMVTLSACETGLGKSGGGEGLLGFAQSFLLAGSRSVCLSLWKVDDTATALLMDRFYRNLLEKKMTKSTALHEAKNWLKNLSVTEATDRLGILAEGVSRGGRTARKTMAALPKDTTKPFEHPKYWAAFILIGAPD
jgi:tetratricopeptide (TPR) repeat protein